MECVGTRVMRFEASYFWLMSLETANLNDIRRVSVLNVDSYENLFEHSYFLYTVEDFDIKVLTEAIKSRPVLWDFFIKWKDTKFLIAGIKSTLKV